MNRDSNKERAEDKDLPGYPHYPKDEDITNPDNKTRKVNLDEENISLPDVRDIPGQEHVSAPPLGMLADTTASSRDEEDLISGASLDENAADDVRIVMGTEADITPEDLQLLQDEDPNIVRAKVDSVDDDNEPLNELADREASDKHPLGVDLDVPGSESDDVNESIGEEDEENNYYSLGSDSNDNLTEGTP